MAIENFNEAQLAERLGKYFTPSQEITDPDRLIGREKYLTQISRSLRSPGRHVFIYGERGVGKTSVAMTAGKLAATDDQSFIYIPCGESTSFFDVFKAIGRQVLNPTDALSSGTSFGLGFSIPGIGGINGNRTAANLNLTPSSLSDCFDILRFAKSKSKGRLLIVIDEIDRIVSADERKKFAEVIKNIGSVVPNVRFILCGIGANVDEIIGEHLSTGRMFEPVEIEKLNYTFLSQIIVRASQDVGVHVNDGFLIRIGKISDGFPHYVHLIGECLFYRMLDAEDIVRECTKEHFFGALNDALQKAEPSIRKIYQMATQKSNASIDYEEALWALADRTSDHRQIRDIYSNSYLRIQRQHALKPENRRGVTGAISLRQPLPRDRLNQRLLKLREDNHANIVIGHGSGFFSFRENVVRGYARLKAETSGIELAEEITA